MSRDELLVDIETDKVVIEVVSPCDGTVKQILKNSGDTIVSNEAIGSVEAGEVTTDEPAVEATVEPQDAIISSPQGSIISPAAKKIIEENQLDTAVIRGTGKDGRITKEDVVNVLARSSQAATSS